MRIDHSRAKLFWHCPLAYYERYVQNIEPAWERESLDFGSRMHDLLAGWYSASHKVGGALESGRLEDEAQAMFAAYQAFYPAEEFDVVEVEQTREVAITTDMCPRGHTLFDDDGTKWCMGCSDIFDTARHSYLFKIDALVRHRSTNLLHILDHKSESRQSKANTEEAWSSKPQVGLYQWGAGESYKGEKFGHIIVNVLRRQSPKGQEAATFYRREPFRTPQQMADNVRWLVRTADMIEECERTGYWPDNRNRCVDGNFRCDYADLHNDWGGLPKELVQLKYRPARQYLDML